MTKLFTFIGRFLIVSLLLSTALIKIRAPYKMVEHFEDNYQTFLNQHSFLKQNLPAIKSFHQYIPLIIRAVGGLEALIALMIAFGDKAGGILFFIYLIVSTLCLYSLQAVQKNFNRYLPQMLTMLILFGIALSLVKSQFPQIQWQKKEKKSNIT